MSTAFSDGSSLPSRRSGIPGSFPAAFMWASGSGTVPFSPTCWRLFPTASRSFAESTRTSGTRSIAGARPSLPTHETSWPTSSRQTVAPENNLTLLSGQDSSFLVKIRRTFGTQETPLGGDSALRFGSAVIDDANQCRLLVAQ